MPNLFTSHAHLGSSHHETQTNAAVLNQTSQSLTSSSIPTEQPTYLSSIVSTPTNIAAQDHATAAPTLSTSTNGTSTLPEVFQNSQAGLATTHPTSSTYSFGAYPRTSRHSYLANEINEFDFVNFLQNL